MIPSPAPMPARRLAPLLRVVAISAVYLVIFLALDAFAASLRGEHGISAWYLPQGAVLGVLLIFGVRYAPLVFLGKALGSLLFWPAHSPLVALLLALVVTLGYLAAAYVLRHLLQLDPRLGRRRDVINFLLVILAAALVVALLSALVLLGLRQIDAADYFTVVREWWNGDLIGLITLTPFFLVNGAPWARALVGRPLPALPGEALAGEDDDDDRSSWKGVVELLIWLAIIVGVFWVSMISTAIDDQGYHLLYLAFLPLIWMAIQHGTRGSTAATLAFSLGVILLLALRLTNASYHWPDAKPELQAYILILALTGLLLGVVVSERHRSEQVVRASEDLLHTLIDSMPDLVIFKDAGGKWLAANDFSLRQFQLAQTPYHGKTDAELAALHPRFQEAFQECRRTDEVAWGAATATRAEKIMPGEDGAARTFDVIKVPLFHPDGRRKGLVMIGRDITERKRAEEELDKERAYLSSAVDILPLPLAFLSPTGEWTQANAASYAFVPGLLPRQWLDAQLLTPDTRTLIPREERPMQRALAGEVLNAVEVILVLPDGREVPMLVHAGPIAVNGKLVAVVAAFQDISAIKEADRAKDEFLGILSHELLTPLTDTLGWSQAARETPDVTAQALEIIEHNARLLHRVMTDLLDLSRIIHGKLFLNREPSNLWKLTEECVKEFAPMVKGRRRTLTLEAPDDEMLVSIDRERLRQVLSTLLTNALKGTDAGDAIIISGSVEGDTAVLTVRDTGRGIPRDTLLHLFTPFFQAQPVEPGRGMGLGLALVKGIVELHGGRITADSDGAGKGSTFLIELPLRISGD